MFLRYTPDGSDAREWALDLGKLRSMEIEQIERTTGLAYGTEFKQQLLKGSARARRALLWTLQRREHPTLKLDDVDFADDELTLIMDKAELAETRVAVAKADIPEAEKSLALEIIDEQMSTAPDAPGKALTRSGASVIGS